MAKILVVEDERDIRDLVSFTLQYAGHEVLSATNGAEGVEQAKVELPDLIIMDVRMPIMTGYEACRVLKAEPTTQHIPVIFTSAKGQEQEVQTGLEAGAVDYILKPFIPDQLVKRVTAILARASQSRKASQDLSKPDQAT